MSAAPSSFYTNAVKVAMKGVPVTPIRPKTKRAFLPDFPTTASTDEVQIKAWDVAYPDHNYGCVARAEVGGVFFWETDSPNVGARLLAETGHDVKELNGTFRVRSRSGRGHYYFRHTLETIGKLTNLSQTYVKGQDWSLRVNREYVVGSGSIHPDTQEPYMALNPDAPILEAPEWLISWWLSQKVSEKKGKDDAPRNERGLIPHGSIHGYLLTNAGKLRALGLDEEGIRDALRKLVEKNCEPPIDWVKVDAMAKSICNFKEGVDKSVALTQKEAVTLADGSIAEVVDAAEEPQITEAAELRLSERAMTSTVLGDLWNEVFKPNDWPMEWALPSLATAGSVLVPYEVGNVQLRNPVVSLYTAYIAEINAGKTQVTEWGTKSLGIWRELRGPHYTAGKWGSAEQLWKHLHKYSKDVTNSSQPFDGHVLINPDELSHLMAKAGIPDASFASTLTTAFYQTRHMVTLGGQGGGKELLIPFGFSLTGGIVQDQFESVFNSASVGGVYDRFLFGLAPKGFKWSYREFPHQHKLFQNGSLLIKPVSVSLDGSVSEVIEVWNKKYPKAGRVVEICLRVAQIFASIDGRAVVAGDDLEKLEPLAVWQMGVRSIYRPNEGENPDAIFANAAWSWIQTHARQWRTIRDLQKGTNYHRRKLGPNVAYHALQGLVREQQVDMWVSKVNEKGLLNPLPQDYTGVRPKIGSGLVRVGRNHG
jgi:hypothetical protein